MRFCQNFRIWFWTSFLKNLNFFHFSWHIIWAMRSAITILLLIQRCRLVEAYRYLKHVRKVHKKISRVLWKKFQLKTRGFVRIFQHDFKLHFLKISLNELLEIKCEKFPLNYHKSCLPPTAQNYIQSCPQCDFSWAWNLFIGILKSHTLVYPSFTPGKYGKSNNWNLPNPQTLASLWVNHFILQGNEMIS